MQKRLYRSKEKKIFGVCGGIAEYMETDPTIVRILFVATVLLFGTGILLYLIMALIMPDAPTA